MKGVIIVKEWEKKWVSRRLDKKLEGLFKYYLKVATKTKGKEWMNRKKRDEEQFMVEMIQRFIKTSLERLLEEIAPKVMEIKRTGSHEVRFVSNIDELKKIIKGEGGMSGSDFDDLKKRIDECKGPSDLLN